MLHGTEGAGVNTEMEKGGKSRGGRRIMWKRVAVKPNLQLPQNTCDSWKRFKEKLQLSKEADGAWKGR